LARGPIMDSIYGRNIVVEVDLAEWWVLVQWSTLFSMHKDTSSLIMLMLWWIWKHHNMVVFDNAWPSVSSLVDTIKAEAGLWGSFLDWVV
jgi:hypothetical protein